VMSSWLRLQALQALHDESIARGATTEDKLIRNGRGGPPIGVWPPYAWKLQGYEDPLARVESRVAHVCHRLKDSMSVQCAHSLSARPALPTVRPCGPLRATVRRGRGGQAETPLRPAPPRWARAQWPYGHRSCLSDSSKDRLQSRFLGYWDEPEPSMLHELLAEHPLV
jgi:hypothetical protein